MPGDVYISFGADTAELEAGMAVASAQVRSLTSDYRDLTDQFIASGASIDSDFGQQMVAMGGKVNAAKQHVAALKEELKGVGKTEEGEEERVGLIARMSEGVAALLSPVAEVQGHFAELTEVIAGAFAVEKISEFVEHMGEAAEQTERLSRTLGIPTEEVGELQYAAAMTGTSLDNISQTLGRFEAGLSRAEGGSGRVAAGLRAIGLSAEELKGKTLDQQFEDIAEAVSKFADGPAKAAALQDLGRGFVQLIPLLDEGKEGFERLAGAAQQAGATTDEFTNARLVEMEHGIVNMQKAAGGLATDTFHPFIDSVNGAVQITTDFIQTLRSSAQEGGLLSDTLNLLDWTLKQTEQFLAETIWIFKNLFAVAQEASLVLIESFKGSGKAIADVVRALGAGFAGFFSALIAAGEEAAHAVGKQFTDLGTVIADAFKGDFAGSKAAFGQMGDDAAASGAKIKGAFAGVFDFSEADADMKEAAANIVKIQADAQKQVLDNDIDEKREYDKIWGVASRHGEGEGENIPEGAKPANPFPVEQHRGHGGRNTAARTAETDAQSDIDAAKRAEEETQDSLNNRLKLHQITMSEWLAQSLAAYDKEADAIQDAYDKELQTAGLTSEQRKAIATKEENALAEIAKKESDAQAKAAEDTLKHWQTAMQAVNSAIDSQIDGLLRGTESLQSAFKKVIASITEDLIKAGVNKLLTGGENMLGGLFGFGPNAAPAAGAGGATTAVIAANTAALGVHTAATTTAAAATTANTGVQSTGIVAWIENTAATLANTIATDAAAIGHLFGFATGTPMVQQTGLAVIHQGEAIIPAQLNPFKHMPSFDIGAWSVPSDMTAGLHEGEMVVPASHTPWAQSLMSNAASGGAGGDGGVTHNHTHNWNISAMDSRSLTDYLSSNSRALTKALSAAMSKGDHLGLKGLGAR